MAERAQSFKKHIRFLPAFHFFVLPVLLLNLANAARHLWMMPTRSTAFALVVAAALLMLALLARVQAVTVQDRVIRLEMRLRLRGLLPPDLQPKINELSPRQLVALRFASFDGAPAPKPQAAMFGKGGSRVVHRELEQAHLTLALEGVPQTDPSLFSLQVFTNTLGGGMSSRLFQEVREKRGLCYSIYTFHAPYTDTGFFGLYTGTDPGDAPEMMEVIVDVINDAVETLTEAEIARAKAQMKAGLLMALESCSSRAEQLARHVLAYGRPLTVEELVARIDAVSIESTRNAARGLLSRSRPAVVALGSGRGLDTAAAFAEGLTRSKVKARLH